MRYSIALLSLALVLGLALPLSGQDGAISMAHFMTVDDARFRRPVVPGDVLKIHVRKIRHRKNVWKFRGEARVEGALMAEATCSAMIMDD